jgi:glycosyltransferase involved in cell wall biosynthesis
MGPALGTILRCVRKNKHTRIVAITDNIIPHEKRMGDTPFTRYFLKSCDAFITMSEKVMLDLRKFVQDKPAKQVLHPLYDNFGSPVSKLEARKRLGIEPGLRVILFFGFIRKYKGLDILLRAMKLLMDENNKLQIINYKLLIAGEFYEDQKQYTHLIEELGIKDDLLLRTDFIPDSEVKYYLCAADAVIQPYRTATQSGVTPLAYHFEKPMIVTNVGSLPDLVPHEKAGLVCEPEPASIAAAIARYFQLGEDYFLPHLRIEKEKYSWHKLVDSISEIAGINNHK